MSSEAMAWPPIVRAGDRVTVAWASGATTVETVMYVWDGVGLVFGNMGPSYTVVPWSAMHQIMVTNFSEEAARDE